MSEKCVCEVCNRSYFRKNSKGRYCSNKCRQWAYQNRQRVLKRAAGYAMSGKELDDILMVKGVSHEAASMILKVSSVAGRDLAREVLDGVWDVMIKMGYRVEVLK